MAEILKTVIDFADTAKEVAFTQSSGLDFIVDDNADGRVMFFIKNGNAQNATVTFKAGNGSLSALGDETISVGGGKTAAVPLCRLESARVKVMDGNDKGRILIGVAVDSGGSAASVSVGAVSVA